MRMKQKYITLSLCHRANCLLCKRITVFVCATIYLVFTPFGLKLAKSSDTKFDDTYYCHYSSPTSRARTHNAKNIRKKIVIHVNVKR